MKKISTILMAALAAVSAFAAKPQTPVSLNVISYNIRNGEAKDGTNSWEFRAPASAMMIDDQKPDVFGLQEAHIYQAAYLDQCFKDYKWVGVGREDGKKKGEIMAVFYNSKRIKLLKWGTWWLSETPDLPSKGWDAACMRTATWTLMKDKKTGRKFYCVNTHLDHKGTLARKNGLALIVEKIAGLNVEGLPVVLTGDFNVRPDDEGLAPVRNALKDARGTAASSDKEDTYNGWGKKSSVIDYIFYNGFSSCTEFHTIKKPYMDRTFISDHFPVKATLVF